jgi:23S rRNA (cytidine1920-2'-O)/16S rRNA (cytidine1409-2'-O)-methyltransferase
MKLLEAVLSTHPELSEKQALGLILAGKVLLGNDPVTKPGLFIAAPETLRLRGVRRFVSRSGEKLDGVLDLLEFPVQGRKFMDIGSSTGGFTDCLLQRGAAFVAAIDVGKGLLHQSLRTNPKVQVLEGIDFKNLSPSQIQQPVEAVVGDVSFTSLEPLLANAFDLLNEVTRPAEGIVLFKPQFELPRSARNLLEKGVLRDSTKAKQLIEEFSIRMAEKRINVKSIQPATVTGRRGNQEYLIHLVLG